MSNILNWPDWRVLSTKENAHDYQIEAEQVTHPPATPQGDASIFQMGSEQLFQLLHTLTVEGYGPVISIFQQNELDSLRGDDSTRYSE